eukprot:s1491_g5.t1
MAMQLSLHHREDDRVTASIQKAHDCPAHDSLTDEFIRFVQAANNVPEDAPEFPDEEPAIRSQSIFVQDLWELWSESATMGPGNVEQLAPAETWFTNHATFHRCMLPRTVVLSREYSQWERQILEVWSDIATPAVTTEFHLVYPKPEDAQVGIFAQVVVVQLPSDGLRSLVISVYDSGRDVREPFSFCQVLPERIGIVDVLDTAGLSEVCSASSPQNECTLWFGSTPIRQGQRVHVRSGYALRLSVRRGISVDLSQLLRMSDGQLRAQLSSATHVAVFRRPPWPAFSGDVYAETNQTFHSSSPADLEDVAEASGDSLDNVRDSLPPWITSLRIVFDQQSRVDDTWEAPFIEILVWYLNGRTAESCRRPRVVRLDGMHFTCRSAIVFACLDDIQRAQPIDLYVVRPSPPRESWHTHAAHVIVAQEIPSDLRTVIVSTLSYSPNVASRQFAYVVPGRLSATDVRTAMSASFRSQDQSTLWRATERLHDSVLTVVENGDGFVIETEDPEHTAREEGPADDQVLLQVLSNMAEENRVSSPAEVSGSSQPGDAGGLSLLQTRSVLQQSGNLDEHDWSASQLHLCPGSSQVCTVQTLPKCEGHVIVCRLLKLAFRMMCNQRLLLCLCSLSVLVVLDLNALISRPAGSIRVPCQEIQACGNDLLNLSLGPTCSFASIVKWRENTLIARENCPDWTNEVPILYTDGASRFSETSQCRHAAASAVSLIESEDGWRFGGFHALTVPLPATAPMAEHAALLLAHVWCVQLLEWLFQHTGRCGVPVTFAFDCIAAGLAASGSVGFPSIADGYFVFPLHHDERVPDSSVRAVGQSLDPEMLSTPREGHYGVQLWISKSIQVASEALQIKAAHLRILSHDARHLIVRFAPPGMRLIVMVGHAPCDGGQTAASDWWAQFGRAIPSSYSNWPRLCLIDANSRIGSLTSCAVGDHQADEENEAGALLHQWLIDNNMFAPQTMPEHHEGPPATFVHSKGNEGRIDCVLVDQCLRHKDIRTRVSDVDLSLQKTDHMPVLAFVPVVVRLSACKRPKPYQPPDDDSVDAPGPISWATDVHTHAATLHSWLRRCQPRRQRFPRKQHLSAETWTLIQQKAYHWKRMRQINSTVRCSVLRAVFDGWHLSSHPESSALSCSAGVWFRLADHEFALHLHQFRRLTGSVLYAVRNDDRAFFQQFADRHTDESFPNLWKSLKCLLPKAASKRRNNLRCIGPDASEITRHFNDLEAGERIEYEVLLEQCHRRQQLAMSDAPLIVPLEHLPTRLDFEKTCSKVKHNKAPGIDGVTSDTLQACMRGQSDLGFLLVLKSFLLGTEPLQWKGGLMHIIPKKTGILRADMMRGIMLLTSLGKIYHATLRKLLIPWVTSTKIPAQLGGFVGQQTSFATHMLRSFCNLAVRHSLSCGVVFVDVKAAFHSMLREHTFGGSTPLPDRLQSVLKNAGLDVLACLQQMGWLTSLAVDLPVFPPLVTWVDDLAIPVPAASAGDLEDHLVQVLSLLDRVFRSYGLQLNRQAGKTEVVCQFRGRGAPACRNDLFVHRFGCLALPDGSSVRAVAQYQHLGTSFSQSLSFTSELNSRLGKAANAYRQMSKGIFRNRSLDPVLRLQLLESLVLSILMYGSGVWPLLSHRHYCKLSHAIIGWQRQITGDTFWCEKRISDAEFLAKWKLPPLSARLAKHRLLYAFQIVCSAPQDVITCISAEDADGKSPWCAAVRHAIEWLLMHMPEVECPSGVATSETLMQWLHSMKSRGPALVRRCARRAVVQDRVFAVCQAHEVQFADPVPVALTTARASFVCHVCSRGFSSVQGLQAHRWRAHGLFSEERKYIYDATCRACNRCFWTTQRLQQHLRWSRRKADGCFHVLQRDFMPLDAPVQCPCPDDLKHLFRLPACQVQGPLIDAQPALVERMRCAKRDELCSHWVSLGLPLEMPADVAACVSAQCDRLAREWISGDFAGDIDADVIIEKWLQVLETSDADADPNSVVTWAFLQWGRDCLPALVETTMDATLRLNLELAFEEICTCFPLWDLLMQFDDCELIEAPAISDILISEPGPKLCMRKGNSTFSGGFLPDYQPVQI